MAQRPAADSRLTWLTLGLLIVALLLRVARIGESLWYDEIALWLTYGQAGADTIVTRYFDPVNHIAHSLVTWLSVQGLESAMGFPLALRLPALLFSLLSVPLMLGLALRGFPLRVAAIAALLVAVLPVTVFEGVEARGYSMMIALTLASTWMLLVARDSGRPLHWLAYAVLAALAVWTHLVAACVFAGHALWLTWRDRHVRALGGVALAAALTMLLYAPVLPDVIDQFTGNFQRTSADQPTLLGAEGLKTLLQFGGAWTWWAALPGLALVALGFVQLRHERDRARRDALALLWLGWPVALIAVLIAGTWVYARFTLFVVPAAALTMALGVEMLWRWRWPLGAVALALVVGVGSFHVLTRGPKQPVREAMLFVHEQRRPHEPVLAVGIAHHVTRMYAGDAPVRFSPMHGRDLPQQLADAPPRWIVVLYPGHLLPDAAVALHAHGYERTRTFDGWNDWGDIEVWRIR
ncbi:MAG: glycosyltransferase family 39 protein [Phycisphaeraceae bacterium]